MYTHQNYRPYVVDISRNEHIPREIAQLGAGRDSYLRMSRVNCRECGVGYTLGASDSPHYCQSCFDDAGVENEVQDGHWGAEARRRFNAGETLTDLRAAGFRCLD